MRPNLVNLRQLPYIPAVVRIFAFHASRPYRRRLREFLTLPHIADRRHTLRYSLPQFIRDRHSDNLIIRYPEKEGRRHGQPQYPLDQNRVTSQLHPVILAEFARGKLEIHNRSRLLPTQQQVQLARQACRRVAQPNSELTFRTLQPILTQRSAHLNDHAGQISFPGGKIDPADASPRDAALREAWEEIGLDRSFIDPIGYLDVYGTGFGFRILPTVARVRPGFTLKINAAEVEDAFEVPLAFLMNPINHQIHSKEFRGMERSFYAMPFAERYIWGATAGILRVLYERIYLS